MSTKQPIRVVVVIEGGCVQSVISDIPLDVHVLDYDVEGGDGDTFAIPQANGKTAPAYRSANNWNEVDPVRVAEIVDAPLIRAEVAA